MKPKVQKPKSNSLTPKEIVLDLKMRIYRTIKRGRIKSRINSPKKDGGRRSYPYKFRQPRKKKVKGDKAWHSPPKTD
jgi:hypothetical protein